MRNRIPKRNWRRHGLAALLLPLAGLATLALPGTARAAPAWQPPFTLSAPGQEADEPELAFDRRGNALVVWHRSDPEPGVLAAMRPAGGEFGAAQPISSGGGGAPQVGFDARGDAIAVWHRRGQMSGGCGLCVEASFRPAGGSFGAPERVPVAGANPQLAVDPAGNALVLARHPGGFAKVVRASFRPAGSSFGAGSTLAGGQVSSPKVAFDARGRAVAVWSGGVRIQSAFGRRGGAFGKPRVVGAGDLPELAVDRRGNALVVWRRGVFPNSRVRAAFRPAGGRFGRVQTVSGPDAGDETDLAFDRRGNALAVWWRRNRNGAKQRVQASFRPAGGRFQRPQTISRPAQAVGQPRVAFDRRGNALAVWWSEGRRSTSTRVQAASRPADGRFQKPKAISRPAEAVGSIRLAFDPQGGGALAVWEELELDRSLLPKSSRVGAAAFAQSQP